MDYKAKFFNDRPVVGGASRMLVVGLNYEPEQVGVGPYTSAMARYFSASGHSVEVITALPYYPEWKGHAGFGLSRYVTTIENNIRVTRCPLYVPAVPTGLKRIFHHLSFALAIIWPLLKLLLSDRRIDMVAVIAPSMISIPVARLFARLFGARKWLHIQDFEVGAAVATGLISEKSVTGRVAQLFQRFAYSGFDLYSSISPQMCGSLANLGIPSAKIYQFRNWGETDSILPMDTSRSYFRRKLAIDTPHVAMYSGVISRKQGLEIVVDAARALESRNDITFLICGSGPSRDALQLRAAGLSNIRFIDLQPRSELNELLGLATIHVLPQIADAADLVLPSKLSNMLASGKPVVATANLGTGLAAEVHGGGLVIPPGDCASLVEAIESLVDSPEGYQRLAINARQYAMERWSKHSILEQLSQRLGPLLPTAQWPVAMARVEEVADAPIAAEDVLLPQGI